MTITPDAGSIQEGDSFTVAGDGFYARRSTSSGRVSPRSRPRPTSTVSGIKGSVDITVTVADQFGLPVAGAQVDRPAHRWSERRRTPSARKTTDANGKATFTFTDANAAAGQSSTVTFQCLRRPVRQHGRRRRPTRADDPATPPTARAPTTSLRLDGVNTAGAGLHPGDVTVVPLTDTVADTRRRRSEG